jgi:hypothetical protein
MLAAPHALVSSQLKGTTPGAKTVIWTIDFCQSGNNLHITPKTGQRLANAP